MSLRHHEIAEARHRILNPFTKEKLRLLGQVAGVHEDTQVLDLASGKGEMLCLWASWFGSGGVGVDLSHVFVEAARDRADELGVTARVSFEQGDAALYRAEPGAFDIASCLGATWIGGGLAGTLALLRPAVHGGGLVLVGEPFILEPMPDEGYAALGFGRDDYVSLADTLERIDMAGFELAEMVLADPDSWDRYEAAHWPTILDWLAANPSDPDWDAMRSMLDRERDAHLRWGRRHLGWGVFVCRPR